MQWVKIPLILVAVVLLIIVFRRRGRVGFRAGTRLVAIVLAVAAIASIADPNLPQAVADLLGVSRGTDLLLYLLVVVFAVTSLGFYFRLQETDVRLRDLARAMAIQHALDEAPVDAPPDESTAGPWVPQPDLDSDDGSRFQPPGF